MRTRGFTLIEVAIGLVIIAIMAAVTIPTLDNITRADLRSAASHTSGMIKATYDLAVLEGKTCRLRFDFQKNTITPEISADYVGLTLADGKHDDESQDEDVTPKKKKTLDKDAAALEKHDHDVVDLMAIAKRVVDRTDGTRKKPQFAAVPGNRPYTLPTGVRLVDVASEHLREPKKDGHAEIYFFPMGSTEHSVIHLEDASGRVFSLELEPLTARTKIVDHRSEFKDDP